MKLHLKQTIHTHWVRHFLLPKHDSLILISMTPFHLAAGKGDRNGDVMMEIKGKRKCIPKNKPRVLYAIKF